MWGVEEEKNLVCKDEKEFRARLKKSFSAGESSEAFSAQQCLVCCEDLKAGRAKLVRKCLTSAFPCSGHGCECAVACCESCLISLLWKSPKSHKGLGRYRANCPFCKAEFCHFDVARVVFEGKPKPASRLALVRVCGAEERDGIKKLMQDSGEENVVLRFAMSDLQKMEVTMSSTERKQAHQLAEELGLGHESTGEGENRVMVLSKPESFAGNSMADFVVFRGYLALCGPSVEYAVSKLVDRVPLQAREKRIERDGKGHHITIFSRKDLSVLGKIAGESKIGLGFVSQLLETMNGVANDWKCEGLGSVKQDKNTAWFAVVTWPSMQSWREKTLRLAGANGIKSPHTFHVTIGFTASDIHDVDKDRTTLI